MDIKTMHIGLDLVGQSINSNVFGRMLPEEKDWYLNKTIRELVRGILLDEKNTVISLISYGDIRYYYEVLQYYIRKVELSVNKNTGYNHVYGDFPTNIPMGVIKSGLLYKGIPYKILVQGGTLLTRAGYTSGNSFVCNPVNLDGDGTMIIGETYRIINAASVDFTTKGAKSNEPGTIFVCSTGGVIDANNESVELEVLTVSLTWDGNTELTPTSNFGYFNYVSSDSYVRYGQSISSGKLIPGRKYIVHIPGTTDFTSVGGKAENDSGFIFTCNADATLTWNGSVLYEVIEVTNRIVKMQDVNNFLEHSFGTTVSSPISSISENKINVYHNFKFDIYRVYLTYIKEPVAVSRENNIDSDLPVSLHDLVIDLTARYINAVKGGSNQPQDLDNKQ